MASNAPIVLVIEDEPQIRRFLRATLGSEGYVLLEAETGGAALREASSTPPDLVLLDLGLPDMDGLEIIRALREWTQVPIIIISARGQEADKVAGLDAGADDYLTKPFGVSELMARIRVAMRHASRTDEESPVFESGPLKVDLGLRQVFVDKDEVRLTPLEFKLMAVMVKHAGKVLTHRHLLKEVWGPGCAEDINYLRVFMHQLRRKIEAEPANPKHLITEAGVGYRLRRV
ncbi:MAG TPA: response regulator [Planctomycetota bacterium]|jgi:two-component system KDP operon response regulator KdpE